MGHNGPTTHMIHDDSPSRRRLKSSLRPVNSPIAACSSILPPCLRLRFIKNVLKKTRMASPVCFITSVTRMGAVATHWAPECECSRGGLD